MIKSILTFFILLFLINDMFDLELTALWSTLLFSKLPAAADSSSVLFVKNVELPVSFMNFSCWIIAKLSQPVDIAFISVTLALAALSLCSLALIFMEKPLDYEECDEAIIEMSHISSLLVKKGADDAHSIRTFSHVTCDIQACKQSLIYHPYAVSLEDLFIESVLQGTPVHPPRCLSYADDVGYDSMEKKGPLLILNPYEINLELLFKEPDDHDYDNQSISQLREDEIKLQVPKLVVETAPTSILRRMSYADAVGYETMEQKLPRKSSILLPYEVDLTDLFNETVELDSNSMSSKSHDVSVDHVFEEVVDKGKYTIDGSIPPIRRRMSYAEAVQYEFIEPEHTKKIYYNADSLPIPEKTYDENESANDNVIEVGSDTSFTSITEDTSVITFMCDNGEVLTFTRPEYSDGTRIVSSINARKDLPRRFSYAEVVGFEFMERKAPLDSSFNFRIDCGFEKLTIRPQPFIFIT